MNCVFVSEVMWATKTSSATTATSPDNVGLVFQRMSRVTFEKNTALQSVPKAASFQCNYKHTIGLQTHKNTHAYIGKLMSPNIYIDSNSSTLCLVLPCLICLRVLYLSLPRRWFSSCRRSFGSLAVFTSSRSSFRDYQRKNVQHSYWLFEEYM